VSEMLQTITEQLEENGNWRREKAEQFSGDFRNGRAVAIFDQLGEQIGKIKDDHPLLRKLEAVYDDVVLKLRDPLDIVEAVNEYHRDIGFNRFPEFIEQYLEGLIVLHEGFLARFTEANDRSSRTLESRVRRKAARRGYRVYKSRQREHHNNQGEFMLVNDRGYCVLGDRYDASLADIEAHLAEVPL
jgi:hypothetical protein